MQTAKQVFKLYNIPYTSETGVVNTYLLSVDWSDPELGGSLVRIYLNLKAII